MAHIVLQIRAFWPDTRIIVRGYSGYCREGLTVWCEVNDVDFLLGPARNNSLEQELAKGLALTKVLYQCSNKASGVFKDVRYQTQITWL